MVGRTLPAGGGTATISAHYVTAACDKKSLPTTVHVRPSNINCNSLRADFSLTKYNPTVLLGNWSEQRYFDACESVNPAIKKKGFIYNPVESVHHDRKRPPAMGGVEPRYTTTLNAMSNWLPALDEQLPDVNTICDAMGKPIDADADLSMYTTSASYLGATGGAKVRFH